ncbi:MAG TPA: nuclear transport factor 2 family protein [Candidatus Limnocylindrales bacterium]|nr:nuclear transport factor 2 family protein [Candidatus Limnocylindrales bacterium]
MTPTKADVTSQLPAFRAWLTAFGDAWESGAAPEAAALFVVAATALPSPFADLLNGRRAIGDWLSGLFAAWPSARFTAQILGAGSTYGVAHWRVSSGSRAIDGVLVCALDGRGRCTSLRMWFHEGRAVD